MRRALVLAAALASGAGATGCTVEYVPIYDSRPVEHAGDTAQPGAGSAAAGGSTTEAQPIGYRRRIRVDWNAIGRVAEGAAEVTGWALYITARIVLETAICCASCGSH